jgi:hypothetical protein
MPQNGKRHHRQLFLKYTVLAGTDLQSSQLPTQALRGINPALQLFPEKATR